MGRKYSFTQVLSEELSSEQNQRKDLSLLTVFPLWRNNDFLTASQAPLSIVYFVRSRVSCNYT